MSVHYLRRRSPHCFSRSKVIRYDLLVLWNPSELLKFMFLLSLTRMYSLKVDVLLQVPPQIDLSAVLAHCPIIHQEEMGMQIVENV